MPTEKNIAKKALLQYLKSKRDFLKKHLDYNLLYVTATDLKDVNTWSEDLCIFIIQTLSTKDPGSSCPWCIMHITASWRQKIKYGISIQGGCSVCSYGTRNGKCESEGSRYHKLCNFELLYFLSIDKAWLNNLVVIANKAIK